MSLESDGDWARKPDNKIDDVLYQRIIKSLDNRCNQIVLQDNSAELKQKAEAVRRSGRIFLTALYELNNSEDINSEDKIGYCMEQL